MLKQFGEKFLVFHVSVTIVSLALIFALGAIFCFFLIFASNSSEVSVSSYIILLFIAATCSVASLGVLSFLFKNTKDDGTDFFSTELMLILHLVTLPIAFILWLPYLAIFLREKQTEPNKLDDIV